MSIWLFSGSVLAQQVYPLYEGNIPNSIGTLTAADTPTITAYIPPAVAGRKTAIIIFPGGAYSFLATDTEGTPIAEAFLKKEIAAFVVKYRLPNDKAMRDKSMAPLMDAQQAVKWVKSRSKEWNIDTAKIGVIGYSAGGHLVSTLGTHYKPAYIPNPSNFSLRPAFMILVYPVVSMDSALTHQGSKNQLLGAAPTPERVRFFSGEANVSFLTPPAYITHAGDDRVVEVENSITLYKALQKQNVDVELHVYPRGDHGFTQRMPVEDWISPMIRFLIRGGWY